LKRLLAEWRGINGSIVRLLGGANDESRIVGAVRLLSEDTVAVE
jgi:hypothetical protein